MNKDNKKEKYYAMLYNAVRVDSGAISFAPNKLISGFYDADNGIFYRDDVDGDGCIEVVDRALPNFGIDEMHILDAIDVEIRDMEDDCNDYFAFPTTYKELKKYAKKCNEVIKNEKEMKDYYERIVRSYLLSSIYDEEFDDNIMLLTDKFTKQIAYSVDTSLSAIYAFETSVFKEMLKRDLEDLLNGQHQEKDEINLKSEQEGSEEKNKFIVSTFNPDVLEKEINSEVINQEHVSHCLVSLIYKNIKYSGIPGMKSNMLILGPSGCGKTELLRSLERHLNIPMVSFDTSSATESGIVGNSVTQALKDLIAICDNDIERAENGIVILDEIDKIGCADKSSVSKGGVQNELLKMLDGDEITIPGENAFESSIRFDPKNVTFIGIGAAQELIEEKKKKNKIGFTATNDKSVNEKEEIIIEPSDLKRYGLKPELLRRLGVIRVVKELGKDDLKKILKESNISNLKLYSSAFEKIDHVSLVCESGFYDAAAEKAAAEKAGASGLKKVIDNTLEVAIRKMHILKGEEGELHISPKTIDNPENFRLYRGRGDEKVLVYEWKENDDYPKIKKLTSSN